MIVLQPPSGWKRNSAIKGCSGRQFSVQEPNRGAAINDSIRRKGLRPKAADWHRDAPAMTTQDFSDDGIRQHEYPAAGADLEFRIAAGSRSMP